MNAFGENAEHVVLSAVPGALSAREAIDPAVKVAFPGDLAPRLNGTPGLGRYRRLAAYMRGFDLVLTYNWGAMDAVAARGLCGRNCPPLIHHEDGFNADEADALIWKRNMFRRLVLPAAAKLVVPSQTLEAVARNVWKQPAGRIMRISNGIDPIPYSRPPEPGSIPGLVRQDRDIVIGTVAGLRAVKNLRRLVRAVAQLGSHVKLVIAGEGPDRDAILAEARRVGVTDRLIMPGFLSNPHRFVGHFDIFALSSDSEQFPISLIEAMAAGLPVVSTDVGDVRSIVATANQPFIVGVSQEADFSAALERFCHDPALRKILGEANRALARSTYAEHDMIRAYAALYEAALGQPGALFPQR